MEARLIQDESFEDAATEWIGMLHPASKETYKAAAIQCDVNYRRTNADLFAALTESTALREELATLRADASQAAEELAIVRERNEVWVRQAETAQETIARLAAELARERERQQDLRQVVLRYRRQHGPAGASFCHCLTCSKADALLEPQPAPVATGETK